MQNSNSCARCGIYALALSLLLMALSAGASIRTALILAGTTNGQTVRWSVANGAFVTDSGLLNNGSQVSVGTALDTTIRLLLAPSATSEHGLTVAMPASSTGNGLQIKNSGGTVVAKIDSTGALTANAASNFGGNLTVSGFTSLGSTAFNSYIGLKQASYTTATTLSGQGTVYWCNATTAAFTMTLGTAIGTSGRVYILKKVDSSANAVTIATTSSQTIDGATTYVLSAQYNAITVVSDGANWNIISKL